MRTYYKIRDKRTGKFRSGGMFGKWDDRGKEWDGVGYVKNHLNQFPGSTIDWENWELVEYRYEPVEAGAIPLKDLLTTT
jgi:hypothetical protein